MESSFDKKLHQTFILALSLKALNALSELLGAVLIWMSSPSAIQAFAKKFAGGELTEDPADKLMRFILNASKQVTDYDLHYTSIFLFSHGAIKLVLIYFLFKRVRIAYPIAIVVFSLFVVYQAAHFIATGSYVDVILILFDIVVVVLTTLEYRRFKKHYL